MRCGLGGTGPWSESEHAKASAWMQPATAPRTRKGRGAAIGSAGGERKRARGWPGLLEGGQIIIAIVDGVQRGQIPQGKPQAVAAGEL